MGKTNRNAPCHCGSGKKYKNCHLMIEVAQRDKETGITADTGIAPDEEFAPQANNTMPIAIGVVILIVAVVLVFVGYPRWGIAVGGCGIILAGIAWAIFDPPKPRENTSDSAAINYGREK